MSATGDHAAAHPIVVSRVLATRSTIKADQRAMVERLMRAESSSSSWSARP
jgi:hypothetical protein